MSGARLDGKVVFITGAARGIGAETARRVASLGAAVSLVGLEPERLTALAAELGAGCRWFLCDVTDQASLEREVAALGGRSFGRTSALAPAAAVDTKTDELD